MQFEAVVIQKELAMPSEESYRIKLWKTLRLNHLIASLGVLNCTQTQVQVLTQILLCALQITKLNLAAN